MGGMKWDSLGSWELRPMGCCLCTQIVLLSLIKLFAWVMPLVHEYLQDQVATLENWIQSGVHKKKQSTESDILSLVLSGTSRASVTDIHNGSEPCQPPAMSPASDSVCCKTLILFKEQCDYFLPSRRDTYPHKILFLITCFSIKFSQFCNQLGRKNISQCS